jgi:hypothetical protein
MHVYYFIKPIIPRKLQINIRRKVVKSQRRIHSVNWPIDEKSKKKSNGRIGWPDNKEFAFVLTHDVENIKGHDSCLRLMQLEKDLGFRSSFNFVPERYRISTELRQYIVKNGFEVGVHGLNHDGKLYKSKKVFSQRAQKINGYLREWQAVGFRSPAMHHNLDWLHELEIEYDSSTFDTDPFEPQSDGMGTIFPFWVKGRDNKSGYVELPYTLPQDMTLFILLQEKDIKIWQEKVEWIRRHGGMVLLNTHPDYMNFNNGGLSFDEYPVEFYINFLKSIKERYQGKYWNVLPRELATYWHKSYLSNMRGTIKEC